MNPDRLKIKLGNMDRKRLALLEKLAAMAPEDLARKPFPKRWSLLQVLQHIILAEHEVLQGMPDPSKLVPRKRNPLQYINYLIVMLILKWDIPVPVPSSGMVPDGNTTLPGLREQWDRNFQWLKMYGNGLTAETARQAVFNHPVIGPLTPAQALELGRLHLESHTRHINRILRQLEAQKA